MLRGRTTAVTCTLIIQRFYKPIDSQPINALVNEGGKSINCCPCQMHPIDWGIRIFKADSNTTGQYQIVWCAGRAAHIFMKERPIALGIACKTMIFALTKVFFHHSNIHRHLTQLVLMFEVPLIQTLPLQKLANGFLLSRQHRLQSRG